METTATYDAAKQEFVINSPSTLSQKFWITNGACHANYAIVFAQTLVGGNNEGVNSFIVRIRDDNMKPCKGVMIEDMGWKIGLNGIDNARLMFDHVRIPREAMLNAQNDVTADGKFVSETKKVSNRFFKDLLSQTWEVYHVLDSDIKLFRSHQKDFYIYKIDLMFK